MSFNEVPILNSSPYGGQLRGVLCADGSIDVLVKVVPPGGFKTAWLRMGKFPAQPTTYTGTDPDNGGPANIAVPQA